jgi:urate oxidase
MGITLAHARYGKAETRVVRVVRVVRVRRDGDRHEIKDLNVSVALGGDDVFAAADRPYGLIEGTVVRDDAPPAGEAW